jgi:hypothetical protein
VVQTTWSTRRYFAGRDLPWLRWQARKFRALAPLAGGHEKFRRSVGGFLPDEAAATVTTLKLSFTLGTADLCDVYGRELGPGYTVSNRWKRDR